MATYKTWKTLGLGGALITFAAIMVAWLGTQDTNATEVTVYKNPRCVCCTKWVEHLRANGFDVTVVDASDLAQVKGRYGIPSELAACHTAIVDGYVVEGHVPADVIQRLLKERPAVAGIAVPGMPVGSPGMEGPYREPYDVLTFDRDGATRIYASRR